MNKKVNVLYARLSREDGEDGVSNSITNQFAILREYATRNNLTPYVEIQDDGYSGTNFRRPGWQELIAKIEADEVSCLILKDSSRMGRNYLQAGLFREMFREKSVRLICVNDGIDTAAGDDDFMAFREIISEWYARDTSKKVKSVFLSKAKSGKPTASMPPYGFVKDPDDKNKWLVDPEAAAVVRRIYQMTVEGKGVHTICGILAEEKIDRPSYYLGTRGIGRHKNDYDPEHRYAWGSATISVILRQPAYTGCTVNLRTEIKNFKSKKSTKRPQSEWLVFENTHEAIIPQETWNLVQKLRETPRRIDHLGEANPLTGLLYCSDCGGKLYNHRKAHTEKPTHTKLTDVYCCSTYKLSNSKFNTQCSAHHISSEAVREIILDTLRKTTGYVREHEQDFVDKLRESSAVRQGETVKSYRKQIIKNEKRLAELDKIYRSLYEDKALGRIDAERFDEMSGGYDGERAELKAKIAEMQNELDAWSADNENADKFLKLVRRYTHFEELTPTILNEFVDKIIVHEGEWSEGNTGKGGRPRGARTQRVEVYLKYIGCFDVPDTRTAEQIEADRIAAEKLEANRAYHREKTRKFNEKKRAAEVAAKRTAPTRPEAIAV